MMDFLLDEAHRIIAAANETDADGYAARCNERAYRIGQIVLQLDTRGIGHKRNVHKVLACLVRLSGGLAQVEGNPSGAWYIPIPVSDLARHCGLHVRTTRRILHKLRDAGYIKIEALYDPDGGGRGPNLYTLTLPED